MLEDLLNGLVDVLLYVPRLLYKLIIDLIELIIPDDELVDIVTPVQDAVDMIPPDWLFVVHALQIPLGVTMVFGTILLMYLYKKIPFLGR